MKWPMASTASTRRFGLEGGGGFSFNQYLIVDEEPLLFHTGLRKMFPLVREAVASVMPVERLRYVAFSHVEADECGSLNQWLDAAPQAVPLCGTSPPWYPSTTLPTELPARWLTARPSRWGRTPCAGSTRRICRTRGSAAF